MCAAFPQFICDLTAIFWSVTHFLYVGPDSSPVLTLFFFLLNSMKHSARSAPGLAQFSLHWGEEKPQLTGEHKTGPCPVC